MSAWMITNDHADFLATAYVRLVDPAADPQAIGRELLHENMRSLSARYHSQVDWEALEVYAYREWPGELIASWVNKNAACADYQCCEHREWAESDSVKRINALLEVTGGLTNEWPESVPWGIEPEHRYFHAEMGAGRVRMILIDPTRRAIIAGWVVPNHAAMSGAIGCSLIDMRCVGRDDAGRMADLIIDDEGRLIEGQRCFTMGGTLFAGRALLAGSDDGGNTVGTALTISAVTRQVQWAPASTDYTPAPPVVIGFESWDMARMAGLI